MDVQDIQDPQFEDFSVGCDKCNKWFHYICIHLSGQEPELQENSDLPYYCPDCVQSQQVPKCKGKGRGKRRLSVDLSSDADQANINVRRSSRVHKPVKRTYFI